MQPVRAAVALDMTLRDVQAKLKEEKYPWTLAKVRLRSRVPEQIPISIQ
jgi:2-keto-4-pentenoate hydratase/2-oxohepta-3-ene-1,7-dioic acid hydratase in catechol pathway